MPTIFSHPAIAVGIFPWFRSMSGRTIVLFAGILLTIVPDLDVIGFFLGIPYEHMFGHRGFSHSIAFAFIVSGLAAFGFSQYTKISIKILWLYFFSFRPIQVSTLSIRRFFSDHGMFVLINELFWVWLPCLGAFIVGKIFTSLIRNVVNER